MTILKHSLSFIKINVFLRYLILLIIFILSIIIGNFYDSGDQINYTNSYNAIAGRDIFSAYLLYTYFINAAEIIHFLVTWLGSSLGISKVLLMAIFNTFLGSLVINLFDKLKVNFYVTISFLLTNFYIYIIFFGAERLKFGIIFFLLSLIYSDKVYHRTIFFILSILSHLQSLIFYSGYFVKLFIQKFNWFLRSLKIKWIYVLAFPFFLIFLSIIQSAFVSKVLAYEGERSALDFLRLLIFFLMSLYYSKSYKNTCFSFLPLFFGVLLVGGERINMVGYMFFLFNALQYRNGLNIGILITTIYYFYMSYNFISNIILTGNGFNV